MKTTRRNWIRSVAAATAALPFATTRAQTTPAGNPAPGTADLARYPELKFINLAGNENPFGPSPQVSLRVAQELPNSCRYPFREEVILKDLIAAREGVAAENVILGNGCDELLALAGAEFGGPGRRIVATKPTYLQLMHYAEHRGSPIDWIDHTKSMHHDLEAMERAVSYETSLVYVCNPDTPSGTMLPAEAIHTFAEAVADRAAVFLDEVYLDLLDDFEEQTQVELVRRGLPVIIGRSFSKLHALAGHRIGYAITTPEIAERLGSHKMSSLNYLGVAAARASLNDTRFHAFSRAQIRAGREKFCSLLDEMDLRYVPSVGNFVFHYTGIPVEEFQVLMREKGFLVGRSFPPYDDWCRISIGTNQEMASYEAAMREVFRS